MDYGIYMYNHLEANDFHPTQHPKLHVLVFVNVIKASLREWA